VIRDYNCGFWSRDVGLPLLDQRLSRGIFCYLLKMTCSQRVRYHLTNASLAVFVREEDVGMPSKILTEVHYITASHFKSQRKRTS
jgi:hypothetical protein